MAHRARIHRLSALAAVALFASCSAGGGDDGAAPQRVSLAFDLPPGTSFSEGDTVDVPIDLSFDGERLAGDLEVSVRISGDDAAGLAELPARKTVTFERGIAAGSRAIALDVGRDGIVRGDATMRLEMSATGDGLTIVPAQAVEVEVLDGDAAQVSFVADASSVGESSGESLEVSLRMELPADAELGRDLELEVRATSDGTAKVGSDYGLSADRFTFERGESDGAQRSFTVEVFDDDLAEGTEAIVLEIRNLSSGLEPGSVPSITIEIDDDEEGVSGRGDLLVLTDLGAGGEPVEELDHGDGLDFGTLPVNSASVNVRISLRNIGDGPMSITPPALEGAGAGDFSLSVLSAPLPLGADAEPLALPWAPAEAPRDGELVFDQDGDALRALATRSAVELGELPLPGRAPVRLTLRQLDDPWSEGGVLHLNGAPVGRTASALASHWTGSVVGHPDSSVFLSFSEWGSRGWIRLSPDPQQHYHVVAEKRTGVAGAPARVRVLEDLDAELRSDTGTAQPFCVEVPTQPLATAAQLAAGDPPSALSTGGLRVARLALETDFQYYSLFGSVAATEVYVGHLAAAASEIFERDLDVRLEIAYLGIYDTPADPWSAPDFASDAGVLLDEFVEAWSPSGDDWPVDADLAHFLSGADLGGGIAYLDVLCNQTFGFGVSANNLGAIDWATFEGDPSTLNWDLTVFAHELGHNFGSPHTHEYCPPVDSCIPNSDCGSGGTTCSQGTLMSYCHLCSGLGDANIDLRFHPVVQSKIASSVAASCLTEVTAPSDVVLAAGSELDLNLRFTPKSTGIKSAALSIEHDAATDPSPYSIGFEGEGE